MPSYHPVQTSSIPKNLKMKNLVWVFVNKTLFRFTPSKGSVFRKFRVFLCRLFGARISYLASIHPSASIEYPWNITIGDYSSVGERAWIYAIGSISIGEYSNIGKEVYLITGSHDIQSSTFSLETKEIAIGNGCWIATRAMILPGISIGDYSVVGAGGIVTKSISSHLVVGGNPAKVIKHRVIE